MLGIFSYNLSCNAVGKDVRTKRDKFLPGCYPEQPSCFYDQMASLKEIVTNHCNASAARNITLEHYLQLCEKKESILLHASAPVTCLASFSAIAECVNLSRLTSCNVTSGSQKLYHVIINTKFTCCIYETKFKCFIQLGDVISDRCQPYAL